MSTYRQALLKFKPRNKEYLLWGGGGGGKGGREKCKKKSIIILWFNVETHHNHKTWLLGEPGCHMHSATWMNISGNKAQKHLRTQLIQGSIELSLKKMSILILCYPSLQDNITNF